MTKTMGTETKTVKLALCMMLAVALLLPAFAMAEDEEDNWSLYGDESVIYVPDDEDAWAWNWYGDTDEREPVEYAHATVGSATKLYSGPDGAVTEYAVKKGDSLELLTWRDDWCQVIVNGEQLGWLPTAAIA